MKEYGIGYAEGMTYVHEPERVLHRGPMCRDEAERWMDHVRSLFSEGVADRIWRIVERDVSEWYPLGESLSVDMDVTDRLDKLPVGMIVMDADGALWRINPDRKATLRSGNEWWPIPVPLSNLIADSPITIPSDERIKDAGIPSESV